MNTVRLAGALAGCLAVAAHADDSAMDTTFGADLGAGGGQATIAFDRGGMNDDVAFGVQVRGTAYAIAVGAQNASLPATAAFAQLHGDGTLDATYGIGGRTATAVGVTPNGPALDAQGRWLVVSGSNVLRFNADGSRDMQFGSGGIANLGIDFNVAALAVDDTGRIVVAGQYVADFASAQYMAVSRLLANGMPDSSFNGAPATCAAALANGTTTEYHAEAATVALGPDGTIYAAGDGIETSGGPYGALVGAFGKNGTGANGCTRTVVGASRAHVRSIAFDAAGRVLVAGTEPYGPSSRAFVARVANGHADAAFGAGQPGAATGETFIAVNDPLGATASALAMRRDGTIVVAGSAGNNMLVARLAPDGALDTTFAGGWGYRQIVFASGASAANALVLDAGRPVLVGSVFGAAGNRDAAVVRLQSDAIFSARFD